MIGDDINLFSEPEWQAALQDEQMYQRVGKTEDAPKAKDVPAVDLKPLAS